MTACAKPFVCASFSCLSRDRNQSFAQCLHTLSYCLCISPSRSSFPEAVDNPLSCDINLFLTSIVFACYCPRFHCLCISPFTKFGCTNEAQTINKSLRPWSQKVGALGKCTPLKKKKVKLVEKKNNSSYFWKILSSQVCNFCPFIIFNISFVSERKLTTWGSIISLAKSRKRLNLLRPHACRTSL